MAKTNKIVYVTQEQYASLITDGYVEVGGVTYNYDANNTYMVQENGLEGTAVQSTGVTSGKVLTANGSGGASWQTAGGSGDVVASGTLSTGAVILGLGNKTVTASNGQNNQMLFWSGGATWKRIYRHLIYLHRTAGSDGPEVNIYFELLSTQSTTYSSASNIPYGKYLAIGDVDQTSANEGHCRALYYNKLSSGVPGGHVGYWKTNSNAVGDLTMDGSNTTISDTVTSFM